MKRIGLCLVAFLLAQGCSDPVAVAQADTVAPYWPGAQWRTAQAQAVGMDRTAFDRAMRDLRAGAIPGLHGFVVIRHGWLIAEEYFPGHSSAQLHTLQSVSKSVTSLLIGIARDSGLLASIDAPVVDLFPEYTTIAAMDANKRALRVRDLLTMRTGMNYSEQPYAGSPHAQLNSCQCDWLKFVLDRPMSGAPDATWSYNSGGVILLGGVIKRAAGDSTVAFARKALFQPIGITDQLWVVSAVNADPHMGGGLSLRTMDLARIGYLVLKDGVWNDKRIVSSAWLAQSMARITTSTPRYFPRATDYGMLWWLFPRNGLTGSASGDDYIVAASGTGGQYLFIDRKNQLVVAVAGALGSGGWPAVNFLFDRLLPAIP